MARYAVLEKVFASTILFSYPATRGFLRDQGLFRNGYGKEMRIRKALLLAGLLVVMLALSMVPPCSNPLSAQSGCCKTRRY